MCTTISKGKHCEASLKLKVKVKNHRNALPSCCIRSNKKLYAMDSLINARFQNWSKNSENIMTPYFCCLQTIESITLQCVRYVKLWVRCCWDTLIHRWNYPPKTYPAPNSWLHCMRGIHSGWLQNNEIMTAPIWLPLDHYLELWLPLWSDSHLILITPWYGWPPWSGESDTIV